MKYGYYIPSQNLLCGDAEFSNIAKTIYDSFFLETKHAGKLDGVSVFEKDNAVVKRVVLQDFFTEDFSVKVIDL